MIHHCGKISPAKTLPKIGEQSIDWQITLSIDGCKVTHTGRCNLSCHTLMGSKLTVTTQHLHHIVVDGSVKAPAQCTVGVLKTQTSCLTVLRKEKRKTLKISKCQCINWKRNLTLDSGHPITKSTEEKEEDTEGQGKKYHGLEKSIKKEIWNVGGLFRLETLMHKREELHEII